LKITACLAALAVLVVGILTMYNRIVMPIKNRTLQEDLADLYWNNTADLTVDDDLGEQYPSGMTAQFRGLYDINEDIGGWVYIPETKVNYAVTLQANDYYNNHSFNKNYSVYGQPYFCENTERESLKDERVLAIWGNNTHDEQMFSSLLSYRRIAYLRENPIVVMNTLYTAARWEIFAVMEVDERERASEFEYIQREFEDDEAFMYYIRQLQRRSLFRSSTAVTAEDSVLLLVTNAEREYGFTGARLVIAARRIADEQAVSTYTINNGVKWPDAYAPYTTTYPTTSTTTVPSTTTSTSGVTSGGETTTQTTTSSTSSVTESTTVPSDGSTTKPSSDEDTSNMGE
jgi:sortase B